MARLSPAQEVVSKHFHEFASEEYPSLPLDDVFEMYAAAQLLKHRNLGDEEVVYGVVDGSDDGGIDGFYIFLNGVLVQEDHPALDPANARNNGEQPTIDVVITQSKNTETWSEQVWDKLNSSLNILLDHTRDLQSLDQIFRSKVLERVGIYRQLSENLATRFPRTSFSVHYVSRAPMANVSARLTEKESQLKALVESYLTPGSEVLVEHVGAERLYDLAGTSHTEPAELRFRNVIREQNSYLGVASIDDYLAFVRDPSGELREDLFESNVRDFEGDNPVNRSIRDTLRTNDDGTEFWWQNNGVTVLGRQVSAPQQTLTIDQPLIVNGLQTTHVIDAADRSGSMSESRRQQGIVVRVIEAGDEQIRDKVIGGTNRQTSVPGPALFASEEMQRQLERYFLVHDWYYERRKNQYKNQGKPAARRVSMNLLAQTAITLRLGRPDDARARPSSILTRAGGYEQVFEGSVAPEAYLRSVQLLSRVSEFLKTQEAKDIMNDFSNVRFYLLVGVAMKSVRAKEFASLKFDRNYSRIKTNVSDGTLSDLLNRLKLILEHYASKNSSMTTDAVFKNAEFRTLFLANITKTGPVQS